MTAEQLENLRREYDASSEEVDEELLQEEVSKVMRLRK